MKIKILSSGVVTVLLKSGRIIAYTPREWNVLCLAYVPCEWWNNVMRKYFRKVDKFDN
jgi:hypothetical protein